MIFSVQRYLEDYFERRSLRDVDQYAVKVANIYSSRRPASPDADVLASIHRIRTVFFRNNDTLDRSEFENKLLSLLDSKFKKKDLLLEFPGGLANEKRSLSRGHRRTIKKILESFRCAIESRAIDNFWQSRKNNQLKMKPEKIGQGLLAMFLQGVFSTDSRGLSLREVSSGIGFVDFGVIISSKLHLIEMKIQSSSFEGLGQLQTYMKTEGRKEGWLVVFDARPSSRRDPIPKSVRTKVGIVKVLIVDINPTAPSAAKK